MHDNTHVTELIAQLENLTTSKHHSTEETDNKITIKFKTFKLDCAVMLWIYTMVGDYMEDFPTTNYYLTKCLEKELWALVIYKKESQNMSYQPITKVMGLSNDERTRKD